VAETHQPEANRFTHPAGARNTYFHVCLLASAAG